MIISHTHKYCFFAIPRTGSQALSQHLLDNYAGLYIPPMHQSYLEFNQSSDYSFEEYTSFTIVRNPLDSLVSSYFKMRNDHNGRFSRGYFKNGRPISETKLKEFDFIQSNDASYSEYFLRFITDVYWLPRHISTAKCVDHVLKYEHLERDFNSLCAALDLNYKPIPIINPTQGRKSNWTEYYTIEARERAKKVCLPIMKEWSYDFPQDW